jgi:hypothetical protein
MGFPGAHGAPGSRQREIPAVGQKLSLSALTSLTGSAGPSGLSSCSTTLRRVSHCLVS